MPDIRDTINSLSIEHRAMWSEHRTCMRKCYLAAVNSTIGIEKFEPQDDSFLDLIDIRLALLFDRAGLISSVEKVTGKEEAEAIEKETLAAEDVIKAKPLGVKESREIVASNLVKIDEANKASDGWGKK